MIPTNSTDDIYKVDCHKRVRDIQAEMKRRGINVYLGSRIRTMSFVMDAFCPWRSYVVIPSEGMPTFFTFCIDSARVASETWLDVDNVRGYFGMGGMDQIAVVSKFITDELGVTKGDLAYETGMSTYTPEGNLTQYEYERYTAAMPGLKFINAHEIVDQLAIIKDEGTINRFREASRQVDEGHKAVKAAIDHGGYKGMTETELAGIAALAMRRAGSVSEWNFAGLNELSSGWRTGLGACTPPTTKEIMPGEALMTDLHSLFKLTMGDHSHNYLLGPVTKRQRWHADNFVALISHVLKEYRAGVTPSYLFSDMMVLADKLGCSDYIAPAVEHGIGLFGDEWRVGARQDTPIPYWTDPDHAYQVNEMVICAMQYTVPEDNLGFRYENPIVILQDGCEVTSKHPLEIEEID